MEDEVLDIAVVENSDIDAQENIENEAEQSTEQVVDTNAKVEEEYEDGLPKGVKKRLDKLTKRLYQQEEYTKSIEAELAKTKEVKVDLEDMTAEEQVRYLARQEAQSMRAQDKLEEAQARQHELSVQTWDAKMNEAEQALPGLRERIADADMPLGVNGPKILKQIMDSDVGPYIADELSKNERLVSQLAKADDFDRRIIMAKLEAKIEAKLELGAYKTVAKQTKTTTSANPTPQSKGGTKLASVNPEDMSYKDYAKWRAAGNG